MKILQGKKIWSIGVAATALLVYLYVAPKLVRRKEINAGISPAAIPTMGGPTAALTPIPTSDIVSPVINLNGAGPANFGSMRFGGMGRRSMTAMRKVTIS